MRLLIPFSKYRDNDGFSLETLSDNDKKEYTNMLDTYHSNPKNLHHPSY